MRNDIVTSALINCSNVSTSLDSGVKSTCLQSRIQKKRMSKLRLKTFSLSPVIAGPCLINDKENSNCILMFVMLVCLKGSNNCWGKTGSDVTAAISCVAPFAPSIRTQCNCSIPCCTDELLHYELQQLLGSTEEAVGIQELVDVAFHSDISVIKSIELNSEKNVEENQYRECNITTANYFHWK